MNRSVTAGGNAMVNGFSAPWPGETIAVPQRIDGWRVVAAAKLPGSPGQPHRYVAVVEANPGPGFVLYPDVSWTKTSGFQAATPVKLLPWREVMYMFTEIVASASGAADRPQ